VCSSDLQGGVIELVASTKVVVNAPEMETQNLAVTGVFTVNGVDCSETHQHLCQGEGALTSGVTSDA
jgi:hypothetical protein